jgi:cytochrome b subunit of formate dehydrogenase
MTTRSDAAVIAAADRRPAAQPAGERYVRRFSRFDRFLHGFLMFSFVGLALTGLPLFFSASPWGAGVASLFGGFRVTGWLHRLFAIVMITVFALHVSKLLRRVIVDKDYSIFWGPSSMVPQPRDIADLFAHFKWFVGQGPRPLFERYTYWEKFDYWAVFWGMAIIGGSGALLWFPEFFSRLVPGWVFNVALLIHGEEALLAVGFIFTIHFFNGHLRPEKFPMDMVIFTGRVSERELEHERPAEYERLVRTGRLQDVVDAPPSSHSASIGRVIGTIAVTLGLTMVGLIAYALIRS